MRTADWQGHLEKKIIYNYNDPGRFDVCRDCPLKLALLKNASSELKLLKN